MTDYGITVTRPSLPFCLPDVCDMAPGPRPYSLGVTNGVEAGHKTTSHGARKWVKEDVAL